MDRIESINKQRVLWCCTERGISPEQLADAVGISQSSMASFLHDDEGLTFLQLRKIGEYFGRAALFFLDEEPVTDSAVHTVQYRTLASQKPDLSFAIKKLIERVERQRSLFLSLREDADDEDFGFSPPKVSANDPKAAAAAVRKWLGLSTENTFDSYRAAVEAKGVLVFRSNGYAGRWQIAKDSPILGFSLYEKEYPVIVVKKARYEAQQTFTLMHELGHLVLHRESSIDDEGDLHASQGEEREANAFAGHLLVPDGQLQSIHDRDRPTDVKDFETWLSPFRKTWGVSVEVILRRLLDVGRLSQKVYAAYREHLKKLPAKDDETGNRVYRHREPKHIFGEPFVKTVLDALSTQRITVTRACSYLDGLKLTDLRRLEQHVAGV